jgi:hypothetical protein
LVFRWNDVVPAYSYILDRPCCLALVHLLSLDPETGAIRPYVEIQDASHDLTGCHVPRNADETAMATGLLDTLLAVILDMPRAVSAAVKQQ